MNVLVSHSARVNIDVETFAAWGEVCSDTMTDGQVVPLGGNWRCEGSAEWVDNGWETTLCLRGLLEVLAHEGSRVACQQGELLVFGHWIISSSKKLRGNLCVVVGLAVAASRGLVEGDTVLGLLAVRLEEHGGEGTTALVASAGRVAELGIGCIHGSVLLLEGSLLLAKTRVLDRLKLSSSLALCAVVHEGLDSLLALEALGLHLVERRIHDLLVHGLELSELGQVNLDVWLLIHQFPD